MTFPALHELMRSYLHQDYDLIGTVDENIDSFVDDYPDLAPRLPSEVDRLIASTKDDGELRRSVLAMGCQLRPESGTYRAWLQQIADRVRARTAG